MAEDVSFLSKTRYAVVTGANRGIGLEVCKQLASKGVIVVLTCRDAIKGLEAVENLKKSNTSSNNLDFHQLDVTDPASVASLADFIRTKFGKLDILVNNAGIKGAVVDHEALTAAGFPDTQVDCSDMVNQTYEQAEGCLETNYYGVKRCIEALLPLLELSDLPRIVNVSSCLGKLSNIPNQRIREELGNAENLTEERVDEIVNEFLRDFKEGSFVEKGWPKILSAYMMSKAFLNAYTRILSSKHPSFLISSVCPGFVRTDFCGGQGELSVEEGAASPVKFALMPDGSSSGLFHCNCDVSSVE